MLRLFLSLLLVVPALASVPYVKTKAEIQEFKDFLDDLGPPSVEKFRKNSEFNPKANPEENTGLYQGDILLTEEQKEEILESFATGGAPNTKNGLIAKSRHWPDNTLIYEYQEDVFEQRHIDAIEAGIADLASVSCLKFRKRGPQDANYVRITGEPSGCFATVGFLGIGAHRLNLALNEPGISCFRHGTIVHEFLHSFGFYHQHSTYDRDDWIQIVHENIIPASAHNFNLQSPDAVSNFGQDYDFASCLHYTVYAFSINGERTMIPIQPFDGTIGQRIGLSPIDIVKLNRLHECPGW